MELYQVGDHEGGGLNKQESTLETPAPQCTSTLPYLRPVLDTTVTVIDLEGDLVEQVEHLLLLVVHDGVLVVADGGVVAQLQSACHREDYM